MKIQIEVPTYSPKTGLQFVWEDSFFVEAHVESGSVTITADTGGLISLARHLLMLASNEVPVGSHFHLDESNSLDNGSCELIIAKK